MNKLKDDLENLNIFPGDNLYLRAGLRNLGLNSNQIIPEFIDKLIDYLEDGTILAPAFTSDYLFWKKDVPAFNENSKSISGALSNILLGHKFRERSSHPTHSFVAIGRNAKELLKNHNLRNSCFEPIRNLMALEGKMLLVGCLEESPGFSSVHLAQFDLNLSQKHFLKYLYRFKDIDNNIKIMKERPGCSLNFDRFYRDYINNDNFNYGKILSAQAICVRAKEAYEIEYAILAKDPRYTVCNDTDCVSCNSRFYNLLGFPKMLLKKIFNF